MQTQRHRPTVNRPRPPLRRPPAKPKSNTTNIAVLAVLAAFLGTALARQGMKWFSGNEDPTSREFLSKVAGEINKTLPQMVDSETELVTTMGFDRMLVYKYRLVNYALEELDVEEVRSVIEPQVTNAACTVPETRDAFLKKGVTLRYMYEDKDSRHVLTVEVSQKDCSF